MATTDNVKPDITVETNNQIVKNSGLEAVDEFNVETTKLPQSFEDVNVLFNVSDERKDEIRNKIFNDIQEGLIELPPGEDAYTFARQLSGKEVNKLQKN